MAPWPDAPPDVKPFMHGWFYGHDLFQEFCGPETRLIVEIGSWLGKSARWFCNQCPAATVVCIDHWDGSPEISEQWGWLFPKLHDTFLRNLWDYRTQVVPLRMKSIDGVSLLAGLGVQPDMVYVDAGHDEQSVCEDVRAVLEAFPDAQILGDDWNWLSVQRGVKAATDRPIFNNWRFWWTT